MRRSAAMRGRNGKRSLPDRAQASR
jgi:hypothetical protein